MLQSPPERDKYFFDRATILFSLPENPNCVYRFTYRISRPHGSKWSTSWVTSILPLVHEPVCGMNILPTDTRQAPSSSRDVQTGSSHLSRVCTATPHRSCPSDSRGYYRVPLGIPLTQRWCSEIPLSFLCQPFLGERSHFFYCFMFSMWAN